MADYKLTKLEKETILLWNEEEDTVRIDTFDARQIARLRKAANRNPEVYRLSEPDRHGGVACVFPKSLLRITYAAPMSDERRAELSEKAKANNIAANLHGVKQAGVQADSGTEAKGHTTTPPQ